MIFFKMNKSGPVILYRYHSLVLVTIYSMALKLEFRLCKCFLQPRWSADGYWLRAVPTCHSGLQSQTLNLQSTFFGGAFFCEPREPWYCGTTRTHVRGIVVLRNGTYLLDRRAKCVRFGTSTYARRNVILETEVRK